LIKDNSYLNMAGDLIKNFKELVNNGKLSSAYLFFGAGSENFAFSRALANFLEKGVFEEPKEVLSEFLVISASPDKGSIGIDKIKDLKYYIWQKPVASAMRIAVVENAQILTIEAQNAALKIVEEPPQQGLIIFLAKTAEDLIPTLNSRLQKIYFPETSKKPAVGAVADETDEFFRKSIEVLMKDPVKNSAKLKQILRRLVLVKQFNPNKRLQLRSLE